MPEPAFGQSCRDGQLTTCSAWEHHDGYEASLFPRFVSGVVMQQHSWVCSSAWANDVWSPSGIFFSRFSTTSLLDCWCVMQGRLSLAAVQSVLIELHRDTYSGCHADLHALCYDHRMREVCSVCAAQMRYQGVLRIVHLQDGNHRASVNFKLANEKLI